MPNPVHNRLEKQADKLGLKGANKDAYVNDTLQIIQSRRLRKRQTTDRANKGTK